MSATFSPNPVPPICLECFSNSPSEHAMHNFQYILSQLLATQQKKKLFSKLATKCMINHFGHGNGLSCVLRGNLLVQTINRNKTELISKS